MIDWGIVAAWGIPVLVLVIVAFGALQWTHRSGKKLDHIIARLNIVEQDDHR